MTSVAPAPGAAVAATPAPTTTEESGPTTDTASYDLTSLVSPYLDLHMMFPLLEYVDGLISSGLVPYSTADVAASRLELLRPTHMVDYAVDIYREVHGPDAAIPEAMEVQKAAVFERLEVLREGQAPLDELCRNEEVRKHLVNTNQWSVTALTTDAALSAKHGVTLETVAAYHEFAKFNFDCGDYQTGRDMLENYLSLRASPPKQRRAEDGSEIDDGGGKGSKKAGEEEKSGNAAMYHLLTVDDHLLGVLWGKLSCEILVEDWEEAGVALTAVKTAVEAMASSNRITALEALQQRTWLLHWSLFVFWNDATGKGLESMVELFTSERYLQAITTNAPHLLRYLTAAVLLCKRRAAKKAGSNSSAEGRRLMRDLVKVMQQCEYSDPIVEFVDELTVKFNFEAAQRELSRCETVLSTDFFLCKQTDLFMEEARVFVFENYCRIHHKIDLDALGDKLAMDRDRAERWIVDLIRNALLDAKIDSENGCVVMGAGETSGGGGAAGAGAGGALMERTRDLTARSGALAGNLRNHLHEQRRDREQNSKSRRDDD